MRNAKIVCTLGPASESQATIRDLAAAGMSVARLNASHGSVEGRRELIENVRAVDDDVERPVAVMLDLQGPEIRTAPLEEPIELEDDSVVRFVEGDDATPEEVGLSTRIEGVEPGDQILIDDGRIETIVTEVTEDAVLARVESGGSLPGRKGVNVPGVDLDLDVVTERDRRNLELAADPGVDLVAASFVRDRDDVLAVSRALEEVGAGDVPIVAKIERAGAVENLEEIVDAAYGVMVARGDLGVECPMEDVPIVQKRIIRTAREAGAPVITATEMLDSMIHERRPTRAEASDVANAVLDGTDAVMLSAETAIGEHPVRVVEAMDRIVRQAERSDEYEELREQRVPPSGASRTDALARSARYLARDLGASCVVAASESGYTALKTAKFRPAVPVVAATPNESVRRQLALSGGVVPTSRAFLEEDGTGTVVETAVDAAMETGIAESGDTVVVISGMMRELEGAQTTDMLKVHVAAEPIATGRSVVSGRASGPVAHAPDGDLSDVPEGAVLALDDGFDAEFSGELSRVDAIVDARSGITGYPAIVARELGIPMVSGAQLPADVGVGDAVTVDAERGVVYAGDVDLSEYRATEDRTYRDASGHPSESR